jgi:AAA+ ATPase superfamily predicted ATPase
MSDKDLQLDDGTSIKWIYKTYKTFINQTILLYGRRKSGKSTIIDEIMYLCKNYIPVVFVICLSAVSIESSSYSGKIPNFCIKNTADKEWFMQLMFIQKGRAELYNTANDIKNLNTVFNLIKTPYTENIETTIIDKSKSLIQTIQNNTDLPFDKKREQSGSINKTKEQSLVKLYKNCIRKNKVKLENIIHKLNKNEICCVNYLDFNPHLMLILDDCASDLKKWVKNSTEIKEIFYNGRHYYMTLIVTSQDDKEVDSQLRKNAIVSFFTTHQSATSNFTRASNAYPTHEKKRAEQCIKRIFESDNDSMVINNKKLIYIQTNAGDPFYYTISDLYDGIKIGCPSLWKLDEKINEANKNSNCDNANNNNSFFNAYHNF